MLSESGVTRPNLLSPRLGSASYAPPALQPGSRERAPSRRRPPREPRSLPGEHAGFLPLRHRSRGRPDWRGRGICRARVRRGRVRLYPGGRARAALQLTAHSIALAWRRRPGGPFERRSAPYRQARALAAQRCARATPTRLPGPRGKSGARVTPRRARAQRRRRAGGTIRVCGRRRS